MGVLITGFLAALLLFQGTADKVPEVIEQIKLATETHISRWEFGVEPTDSGSEKSGLVWNPVSLNHASKQRQVRYRTEITIPKVLAGTKITGGKATLRLSIEGPLDYKAVVTVNGEEILRLPIVDPETKQQHVPPIVLTDNAVPGDTYTVDIRISNRMIYPPNEFLSYSKSVWFHSAILELVQAEDMIEKLNMFRVNIETGYSLTQAWTPDPNEKRVYWPERVSRTEVDPNEHRRLRTLLLDAVQNFDLNALKTGDSDAVDKSMASVMAELNPLSDYAKQYSIYIAGNAHIDLAWQWRTAESEEIAANTFRSALNNIKDFRDMVYAQSQAQAYSWVEKSHPELFSDIQAAVQEGNWDTVGGMWAEPDCNLPGGESWVRHLLYGQRYFSEHFEKKVRLGWNPDSFGYNWDMPQLYRKAGIEAFITQKISWNQQTIFPYHLFWWEAPDGSRILTYFPTGSYVEQANPQRLIEQLRRFEDSTGFKEMLVLIGIGNHGGGPNRPMLKRVEMLKELPIFPKVKYIRPHDYVSMLLERDLSDLPVWRHELYLENHRGTFTTQAETKKYNRKNEALLETAEKAASMAFLSGMPYPPEEFESAWKAVLLNQFHDILPGSSITSVYRDADETNATASKRAKKVLDRSLSFFGNWIRKPEGAWKSLLVFNPLSWERDDIIRLPLPDNAPEHILVKEMNGTVIPSQVVGSEDGLERILIFFGQGIPSIGWKTFALFDGKNQKSRRKPVSGFIIENEFLRVEADPKSGNIVSLFEKLSEREALEKGRPGNILELHENLPSFWDAWNIGYTDNAWTVDTADSVSLVEEGPVRSVLRIKKSFLGLSKANLPPSQGFPSSFFVQDIILWKGIPRVDVEMAVDWWEDHTLLKVSFPFNVNADTATYEIPFGSIERSTRRNTAWEKARFEVPVHRWADLSGDRFGISLLNDCKYGMDITDNVMRLTLLTSALWPDPLADRGKSRVASFHVPG